MEDFDIEFRGMNDDWTMFDIRGVIDTDYCNVVFGSFDSIEEANKYLEGLKDDLVKGSKVYYVNSDLLTFNFCQKYYLNEHKVFIVIPKESFVNYDKYEDFNWYFFFTDLLHMRDLDLQLNEKLGYNENMAPYYGVNYSREEAEGLARENTNPDDYKEINWR